MTKYTRETTHPGFSNNGTAISSTKFDESLTDLWDEAVITFESISNLLSITGDFSKYSLKKPVRVLNYYPNTTGGGGVFYYDSSENKANHNGGTIINPDHNSTIGSVNWYSASGDSTDTTGSGCWVREDVNTVNLFEFGVKDDNTNNQHYRITPIINHFSTIKGGNLIIPDIDVVIGNSDASFKGWDLGSHKGFSIIGSSKGQSKLINNYDTESIIIFDIESENITIKNIHFDNNTATGQENFNKYGLVVNESANDTNIENCTFSNGMILSTIGSDSNADDTKNVYMNNISFYTCDISACELADMTYLRASNFYFEDIGGIGGAGSSLALTMSGLKQATLTNFIFKNSHGFKVQSGNFRCYDVNMSNFFIESRTGATMDSLVNILGDDGAGNIEGINLNNFVIKYRDEVDNVIRIDNTRESHLNNISVRKFKGETSGASINIVDSQNIKINNLESFDAKLIITENSREIKVNNSYIVVSSSFNTLELRSKDSVFVNTTFINVENDFVVKVEASGNRFIGCNVFGGESIPIITEGDRTVFNGCEFRNSTGSYGVDLKSTHNIIKNCNFKRFGAECIRNQQNDNRIIDCDFEDSADTTAYSLSSDISSAEENPTVTLSTDSNIYNFNITDLVTITDDDSSNWKTYIKSIDKVNKTITLAGTSPSGFAQSQNVAIAKRVRNGFTMDAIVQNSDYLTVTGNNFGSDRDGLDAISTNDIIRDNKGFKTENRGTTSIESGNTSVSVTHGLDYTPSVEDVAVNANSGLGSASYWYIDSVTASQFDIKVDADPTQTVNFSWKAGRNV